MANYEEEVRRRMEQAAAELPAPECPVDEPLDAAFGLKRGLRKLGAKVGLVKHPSAQAIGDIKRGKVGDHEYSKPPKRRK